MPNILSKTYGRIIGIRNRFYDRGIKKTHGLGARTISVGNITAGGTGKTPVVAMIARMLADNGESVCILSRGYGRRNENENVVVSNGFEVLADVNEAGDEPFELALMLLGKAAVIANADRVAAAASVMEHNPKPPTVFLLDDAFQHRRVERDLDLVCIDATDPFSGGELLPKGKLREPLSSLSRAGAFVITRADLANDLEKTEKKIRKYNDTAPIFYASAHIVSTTRVGIHKFDAALQRCERSTPVFAACAIGNPQAFFETLRKDGWNVIGTQTFRDHYSFTLNDTELLEKAAAAAGAGAIFVTRKDAVKLAGYEFGMPVYSVDTETTAEPSAEFRKLILGF